MWEHLDELLHMGHGSSNTLGAKNVTVVLNLPEQM